MDEITFDAGIAAALDSLLNDRLALLAGAGLSMASPSCLPSAAVLADAAKRKYDATYGADRAPLPAGIEQQAEFFFQHGELATVYFRTYIDRDAFAGPPNAGHFAVADLLLARGIQVAVTTNVDTLIETAGNHLYGQLGVGIDMPAMAALQPNTAPFLKIHGCRVIDPANMVWAAGQLASDPVRGRIAANAGWLADRLFDRDLLIVGYWTDWDYLNGVLAATLGVVRPSRVIVVDLCDGAEFERKAPDLFALGRRAGTFHHVRASGAIFLDALRQKFSTYFIRGVLRAGVDEFTEQSGAAPTAAITDCPVLDNLSLWQMRRDLEGRAPNEPAKNRVPPNEPLLGLTLLQLRASGATPDGPYWLLNGNRVRVLRAPNQALYRVEALYERETPPVIAPAYVIAVGADDIPLPPSVARARPAATITRGGPSRWLSRSDAVRELHL